MIELTFTIAFVIGGMLGWMLGTSSDMDCRYRFKLIAQNSLLINKVLQLEASILAIRKDRDKWRDLYKTFWQEKV